MEALSVIEDTCRLSYYVLQQFSPCLCLFASWAFTVLRHCIKSWHIQYEWHESIPSPVARCCKQVKGLGMRSDILCGKYGWIWLKWEETTRGRLTTDAKKGWLRLRGWCKSHLPSDNQQKLPEDLCNNNWAASRWKLRKYVLPCAVCCCILFAVLSIALIFAGWNLVNMGTNKLLEQDPTWTPVMFPRHSAAIVAALFLCFWMMFLFHGWGKMLNISYKQSKSWFQQCKGQAPTCHFSCRTLIAGTTSAAIRIFQLWWLPWG